MTPYDELAKGLGFTNWEDLLDYAYPIDRLKDEHFKNAVNWLCVLHGLEEKLHGKRIS